MNIDKRYCQNRQRKRKRTALPVAVLTANEGESVSPSEEERQFKLRRFVDDVGKFLSEKESIQELKTVNTKNAGKAVKKVFLPNSIMNKCGGMQTKLCKRGVMTRKMTAKLDENMHQIISLANANQSDNCCQCTHHCKGKKKQKTGLGSYECLAESQSTSILRPLQLRSSPSNVDFHNSQRTSASLASGGKVATPADSTSNAKSLAELDKELYPLFARVVSVSCTQTKYKLFKNQSYVSAVKKELLKIYINGMNKNKQEVSCSKESVKSMQSVSTSPIPSTVRTQPSHYNKDVPFRLAPSKLLCQSTTQFLEENIGPSTGSSKQVFPSPPQLQSFEPHHKYRPPTTSLLSPPVVERRRPHRVSPPLVKPNKYVHEPYLPTFPSVSPFFNKKSNLFGGCGDSLNFNRSNSFLPPIEEEDSPDFRFYQNKLF